MNRVLVGGVGLLVGAALVVGCSSSKTSTPGGDVSTGGKTEVKVEGSELAGLDANSVTCVKQGDTITVASGQVGGQQGLGIVMNGNPPAVQSLSMVVDGNALAVANNMGMKVGSADVKVDGSTYTITGQATGADLKNPMAGQITKSFSVKVDCK
jgi:lipoprotein LpqH